MSCTISIFQNSPIIISSQLLPFSLSLSLSPLTVALCLIIMYQWGKYASLDSFLQQRWGKMFHNPEWMEYFTIASSLPLSDYYFFGRVVFHFILQRLMSHPEVWEYENDAERGKIHGTWPDADSQKMKLVRLWRSPATFEGLVGLYVTFNGCSTVKCETNLGRVHKNKKTTGIRCISITWWLHRQARRALTNQSGTSTTFTRV